MDALVERLQRPPGGVPDDESAAEAFDDQQGEGANEQNVQRSAQVLPSSMFHRAIKLAGRKRRWSAAPRPASKVVYVFMRPLWTCPTCGERFISANLWHSCGRRTYDRLFAGGLSRHYKVCYVALRSEDDVDRDVAHWMRRAYRFGREDHLS